MNRRQFLATIPLAVTGCGGSTPTKPATASNADRERRLAALASFRVASTATRTTPKPPVDVVEQFPELKPLLKVAIRLHPRYGDEPAVDESKLGGPFLWPEGEPWPRCPEFGVAMQPVLQLRAEDVPPKFPLRPESDLFQLFWTPRQTKLGPPHVIGVWRKRGGAGGPLISVPASGSDDFGYVPVPCRLFPERTAELPPTGLMPQQMRSKIESRISPKEFDSALAAAPGTKAGGWPRSGDASAKCLTCVNPMEYLLTIDSAEWTAASVARWKPNEDRDEDGFRRAAGFNFGKPDAAMQVYICRRCEKWPLRAVRV